MNDNTTQAKRGMPRKRLILAAVIVVFLIVLLIGVVIYIRHVKPAAKRQTVVAALSAKKTLLDAQGSEPEKTKSFKPAADWLVDWSYDCAGLKVPQRFEASVFSGTGAPSYGSQQIRGYGPSGSGSQVYHRGMEYYLSVDSHCRWQVRVKG